MYFVRRAAFRVTNSLWLIALVYISSLLIGALVFSVAEHRSLIDSFWWAQVTALTIGYGDIFPTTTPGRIVATILDHFWIMAITPMVIANVAFKMIRNLEGFTHREQEWMFKSVEQIAAQLGVKLDPQPFATTDGEVVETAEGLAFADTAE